MTTLAEVRLWGRTIGAVSLTENDEVGQVCEAVSRWPEFAAQAGVAERWMEQIRGQLRLDLI
ncbi:hypothetical protein [Pseudomonas sp. FME51]|uniref:hypothetical protein n=1 Tax=Pseudomonas sp. FME51 TaxID=2742609 RepID=UPI0018692571|nr:hypothetical protein [Pseudomonas sp. FME51]